MKRCTVEHLNITR